MRLVLANIQRAGRPPMSMLNVQQARLFYEMSASILDLPEPRLARVEDLQIPMRDGQMVQARLFAPSLRSDTQGLPTLVYFHGGGFTIGSIQTHNVLCRELARIGHCAVVSVNYRLAPEHRFPIATNDAWDALNWVSQSARSLGLRANALAVGGDSAGGNLTIVTTMALRDKPATVPVLVQFPLYPVVTLDADWPSMREFANGFLLTEEAMVYFGEGHAASPGDYRSEPLNFPQEGMPPSLVTTASLDPLRDQGLAYVEKLKQAAVHVQHISADGNIHGHINIRQAIPSVQTDVESYIRALKIMLAEVTPAA
mgnify:CR=1 FL=1